MNPAEAWQDTHERILRCGDIIRLITMALDGDVGALSANEREALATVTQCALDEAVAARQSLDLVPQPRALR